MMNLYITLKNIFQQCVSLNCFIQYYFYIQMLEQTESYHHISLNPDQNSPAASGKQILTRLCPTQAPPICL